MSKFIDNIKFANAGIRYFLKTEKNGRIQVVVAFFALIAALFFDVSSIELCIVLFCIALILSLEMVNTALERVCSMLSMEYHPVVKVIKDVAAGAVWFSSIITIVIGLIIFIPYLLKYFNQ